MAGEEAIVHERLASVTSAGAGELAARVVKDDRTLRRKDDKSETEAISRHSERLAKESSLLQYKASAKNENNSTETNLFTHSPIHLFTLKRTAFTLAEGATHVAHCDKSRRVAFTLAEVLITLGIIGVVAAITLPTLIQNYQKQVFVNQLKKMYNSLNNGMKQMIVDEGCSDVTCASFYKEKYVRSDGHVVGGYVNFDEDFFALFKKKFQLTNVQEISSEKDSIYNYKIKPLSGSGELMLNESFLGLGGTTPDGMFIMFCGGYNTGYLIVVDVNGLKKPNQYGRDIFIFVFSPIDGSVVPLYSRSWAFDGGDHVSNIYTEEDRLKIVEDECNPSLTESSGGGCAEKIIRDGWKMNY